MTDLKKLGRKKAEWDHWSKERGMEDMGEGDRIGGVEVTKVRIGPASARQFDADKLSSKNMSDIERMKYKAEMAERHGQSYDNSKDPEFDKVAAMKKKAETADQAGFRYDSADEEEHEVAPTGYAKLSKMLNRK